MPSTTPSRPTSRHLRRLLPVTLGTAMLLTTTAAGLPSMAAAEELPDPATLAGMIAEHHGLEDWDAHSALAAHVIVDFGEQRIIDHDFTFAIDGAAARMDGSNGLTVLYDGDTAWLTPPEAEFAKARFHVLTWPWFIRAPFTVQRAWQQLGTVEKTTVQDQEFLMSKQTFADDAGDTPDDWYRLLVDPATGRLAGMFYIVTYGKDLAEAQEKVSLIRYHEDRRVDGALVSTQWKLYHADPDSLTVTGDGPKATATVSNVRFLEPPAGWFDPPEKARELPLP